jgi:transposase, IS5 family
MARISHQGRGIKPWQVQATGAHDLFRSRLDQILNMQHQLVKLAKTVNWRHLEAVCGEVYSDGPGSKGGLPPLPTRLMAGLQILKFTFDLSDEELCDRWVENPYFQFFCGEEFFLHELSFDRSSLSMLWHAPTADDEMAAADGGGKSCEPVAREPECGGCHQGDGTVRLIGGDC